MADLSDFIGDTPLRASLARKRARVQERIEKLLSRLAPLQAEDAMYEEMLAAIDKRTGAFKEEMSDISAEHAASQNVQNIPLNDDSAE